MPESCRHARQRRAQRAIADDHIDLALDWGRPIRQRDGRVAWHLGRKEVRRAQSHGIRVPERARGVALVVAADGTVVTAVRSYDRRRLSTAGRRRRAGGRR